MQAACTSTTPSVSTPASSMAGAFGAKPTQATHSSTVPSNNTSSSPSTNYTSGGTEVKDHDQIELQNLSIQYMYIYTNLFLKFLESNLYKSSKKFSQLHLAKDARSRPPTPGKCPR